MLLRVCSDSIIGLSSHGLKYLPQLARGAKMTVALFTHRPGRVFCKQSQLVSSCFSSSEIVITDCLVLDI